MKNLAPVITIDGFSGSGKGTIAKLLAKSLGWHFLDSGILYRAMAWAVIDSGVDPDDHQALQAVIDELKIQLREDEDTGEMQVFCQNQEVTDEIRAVTCSQMASRISAVSLVRAALMEQQRAMRRPPGLVTDGRDMGTVVFPDATVKFYFKASLEERAKRRYNQLKVQGKHDSLRHIQDELHARDERDLHRAIAPAKPDQDAIIIDTTDADIDAVLQIVLTHVRQRI